MQITLTPDALETINVHCEQMNEMIEEYEMDAETISLTPERIETLVSSIVVQLGGEGVNLFEDYDEAV